MEAKNPVKSLRKAVAVLMSFSASQTIIGTNEMARKVGISKTSAHRIITTLNEAGILERDEKTAKYQIGPALYVLGSLYLKSADFLKVADSIIKEVSNLTSEVVNLAIFDKGYITIVLREDCKHHLRLMGYIGYTSPAYAHASGKALLSEFNEAEIDRLYPNGALNPLTKKTVATKTELKRELELVRKTGVAVNVEQAFEGEEAYGSVIRNASGKAIAALAVAVPVFRVNEAKRQKLASFVKLAASLISYRLGYQDKNTIIFTVKELRDWWNQNCVSSINKASSIAR